MPPSELRKEAREALKGKWKKAACITLAFLAISLFVGFIQGFVKEGSTVYNIIDLIVLVIDIPLSFGLLITFMKLKRNEKVHVFDFFKEGFSRFGRSWGIWFHTLIKLILPIICSFLIALLLIYLHYANAVTISIWPLILIGVALFIATVIYVGYRGLLYVIAYNISYDNPNLSSKECVKKSAELMKGNRGNYFMLLLSFIGWILLIFIALFLGIIILSILLGVYVGILLTYVIILIGLCFLMSYMQVSTVCFYERVIKTKKN